MDRTPKFVRHAQTLENRSSRLLPSDIDEFLMVKVLWHWLMNLVDALCGPPPAGHWR